MSAIKLFAHSTAKFFSCIGSLLAGEYNVTAPGVSNSAYLGHEASFDQKASSYRSELFGKLGA